MSENTVVLAYSGGLDTSFCVPYLAEQGYDVVTMFCDTGGVSDEELDYIETRSEELGAKDHVTVDASKDIWEEFVVPAIWGGAFYQNQYPLLCSDRYVIVRKSLELADKLGTKRFAHGCTGMGNDQVRFDVTVRALGDYTIHAPIREIQREIANVRDHEREYLEERGHSIRAKTSRYTINENLLGVTISGSEIDEFKAPTDETYKLSKHPSEWPSEGTRVSVTFDEGVPTHLDGVPMEGPALLQKLHEVFGAYGVGRGIYTGDTVIGLKGRIVFEAPGLVALHVAHRALEEAVLTHHQNSFKPFVAQKWVELVYKGFFYDPCKSDLEGFLKSTQSRVTGEVTLESLGGQVHAVAINSENVLQKDGAVYAQSADWGAEEAEGFIKLFGMSTTLWSSKR